MGFLEAQDFMTVRWLEASNTMPGELIGNALLQIQQLI